MLFNTTPALEKTPPSSEGDNTVQKIRCQCADCKRGEIYALFKRLWDETNNHTSQMKLCSSFHIFHVSFSVESELNSCIAISYISEEEYLWWCYYVVILLWMWDSAKSLKCTINEMGEPCSKSMGTYCTAVMWKNNPCLQWWGWNWGMFGAPLESKWWCYFSCFAIIQKE